MDLPWILLTIYFLFSRRLWPNYVKKLRTSLEKQIKVLALLLSNLKDMWKLPWCTSQMLRHMHFSQIKKHGILPEKCALIFYHGSASFGSIWMTTPWSSSKTNVWGDGGSLWVLLPFDKVHKMPINTRPVVSDYASVTHSLGKWVDMMLQPAFAQDLPSFKDSFNIKKTLNRIQGTVAYLRPFK